MENAEVASIEKVNALLKEGGIVPEINLRNYRAQSPTKALVGSREGLKSISDDEPGRQNRNNLTDLTPYSQIRDRIGQMDKNNGGTDGDEKNSDDTYSDDGGADEEVEFCAMEKTVLELAIEHPVTTIVKDDEPTSIETVPDLMLTKASFIETWLTAMECPTGAQVCRLCEADAMAPPSKQTFQKQFKLCGHLEI